MRAAAALGLLLALARPACAHPLEAGRSAEDFARAWTSTEPFKADEDRFPRDRQVDLRRLRVDVTPDLDSGSIEASLTLEGSVLARGLRRLELDAVGLTIESVADGAGRRLEYEQPPDKLAVLFKRKLEPGEPLRLTIRYSARPKMGLYFFKPDARYPGRPLQLWSQGEPEEARHWLPIYDAPNQRSATEISATVPDGLTVVSNGVLESKKPGPRAGTTTWHWVQDKPHAPYLIDLVVGTFTVGEDRFEGVPLRTYVPPGRAADAVRTFGRTKDMLAFYTKTLGRPYPWAQYAQVALYEFSGGMENTSATSLTDQLVLDEKAAADNDWSVNVTAHELAHQWFGDLLTCEDWSQLWLNEGFATYFQGLYREHWLGHDEGQYDFLKKARGYFGEAHRYERPIVTRTYAFPWAMFDGHTYSKGAWVLRMLRKELGEADFWGSIGDYLDAHKLGVVETEDLRRAMEKRTGRTMDAFFHQWLYSPGHPKLDVTFEWDAEGGKARLRVAQKQDKPFSFDLPIEFRGGLWKDRAFTAKVSKKQETFEWELPGRPKLVRVDPELTVLAETELSMPRDLLLRSLEDDPEVPARLAALDALKKDGGPEAQSALERSLRDDKFWGVRVEAAGAVSDLGGDEARDALIQALRDENPKVRSAAARGLERFVLDEKAFAALEPAARGDASWNVRQAALTSLGRLRRPEAAPILLAALKEDSWNESVRRGALDGLASLKDPAARKDVEAWASPGKPVLARERALAALASIGRIEETQPALDFLVRTAQSETDAFVLRGTIGALAALGEPDGAKALAGLAARDGREGIRRQAQEAVEDLRAGRSGRVDELSRQVDSLRADLEKLWKKLDEKKK